jgi:hypothetical protein
MYLVPTDDEFVESIAKTIARNRMHSDASNAMEEMIGIPLEESNSLESTFDEIFNNLWSGTSPTDARQRGLYRSDALAAIRAINLKLITSH